MKSKNAIIFYIIICLASISLGIYSSRYLHEETDGTIFSAIATPFLNIDYPNPESRIHSSSFTLEVTSYVTEGGYSITSVVYIIKNGSFQTSPIALVQQGTEDRYTKDVSISNYLSGEYELIITSTSSSAEFTIKSVIVYFAIFHEVSLGFNNINYKSDNVIAESYTNANCSFINNASIQNLDTQLTLPEEFTDSTNVMDYQIVRGFKVYNPITIQDSTLTWLFSEYQDQDTMYFSVETPSVLTIDLDITTKNELKTYYQEFSIKSDLQFTNILVEITLQETISADSNWELQIRYEADFQAVDKTLYNFTTDIDEMSANSKVSFVLPLINKGETYVFRLYGQENPRINPDYQPYIYGVVGFAGGFMISALIFGKIYNDRFEEGKIDEIPNRKIYTYAGLIGVAGYVVVAIIFYIYGLNAGG